MQLAIFVPEVSAEVDLEGVEVFVKVVETGSFTEAARQLSLPKSTVSRRVTRLEDNLGVRLLQRTTRKIALTEAGLTYFERVGPALESVRAADNQIGEMQTTPKGMVRITAPYDFGTIFLTDIASRFVAEHPDISLDISLSDKVADLISEGFDMAFRGGKLEDSTLVARPLGRGRAWVVASPSYLSSHPQPERPEDLIDHECVLFRAGDGETQRWPLSRHEDPDGEVGVDVRGRIHADEFGFVKSLVISGHGIAAVPWLLVKRDIDGGRLVRLLPEWGFQEGEMSLVYPSARHLPLRVAVFRDFVLEWIKHPPWSASGI